MIQLAIIILLIRFTHTIPLDGLATLTKAQSAADNSNLILRSLSPEALGRVNPSGFDDVPLDSFKWLSGDQLNALPEGVLADKAAQSADGTSGLLNALAPEDAAKLPWNQITPKLTPDQLKGLDPQIKDSIPAENLLNNLPQSTLKSFDGADLNAMPGDAFKNLRADKLAQISPDALSGMDYKTFSKINPEALRGLTPEQMKKIPPRNLGTLPLHSLERIPPQSMSEASPAQLNAIGTSKLSQLPNYTRPVALNPVRSGGIRAPSSGGGFANFPSVANRGRRFGRRRRFRQ